MEKRSQWASNLGFLLATAGAAIGLGNLWKFPYLMGRNGGFAFLAAYLAFTLLLGLPVMITEVSIGRYTKKNPVGAFRALNPKVTFIGVLGVVSAFIILSYYSVIGGWILKYIASYLTTWRAPADFPAYAATTAEPLVWHLIFMLVAVFIGYKGTKGIEKVSKVMMPALFILLAVLAVRALTLPGAGAGVRFIFLPAGSSFTFGSVTAALGQVFYSMSLGMGVTLTYGSYLNKNAHIPGECAKVAGLDTLIALLAGLAIFPAVFAFGLEPAQGPALIFGTLTRVFGEIPAGGVFAILFFLLLLFAAVTSAIGLVECLAAFLTDTFGWKRGSAVAAIGGAAFLFGIPSSLSFGILKDVKLLRNSIFDFLGLLTDNILLPVGGLALCIYVGWFWGPGKLILEMEEGGRVFKLKKAWIRCIRLITPALIGLVTVLGISAVWRAAVG